MGFNLGGFPYFDIKDPSSPVWGMMKGMLYGAYEKVSKEVVVEKSRRWANDVALIRKLTDSDPRILAPVRPIPEIISSFILVSRKSGAISKIEDEVRSANRESNSWSLSRIIWEKYIYSSWRGFKSGYEKNPECFLLLPYENIVNNPADTMKQICNYLDIDDFTPETNGLSNPNPEDDSVYGIPGLHKVREELKITSPPAWDVLGEECYEFWASKRMEFWEGKTN
jgi:sulfotransferase